MPFRLVRVSQITISVLLFGMVIWNLSRLERWLSATSAVTQKSWHFVVSGDSRNCGDVVMPTIATHSLRYAPAFYWHLGDLRAIYKIDEDMRAEYSSEDEILSCDVYYRRAWSDFVRNQVAPFGKLPFYLGIGNHEVIPPKTEDQFADRFKDWLTSETLNRQRLQDGEKEPLEPRAYYHWIQGGVDFIYLDNASDSFSKEQLDWFDQTLARDEADKNRVLSVVVGMHEALPDSIASNHSMCDGPKKVEGCASGRHVYEALLRLQTKKAVYVSGQPLAFLHGANIRQPSSQSAAAGLDYRNCGSSALQATVECSILADGEEGRVWVPAWYSEAGRRHPVRV